MAKTSSKPAYSEHAGRSRNSKKKHREPVLIFPIKNVHGKKIHEKTAKNLMLHNSVRKQIWNLAADKTKDSATLVKGLIRILGISLNLRRITHSSVMPEAGEIVDAEWGEKGVKSLRGHNVPGFMQKYFSTEKQAEYDEKSIDIVLPAIVRSAARAVIEKIKKIFGALPLLYTPYFIGGKRAGVIYAQKISGNWTADEKGLMLDAVKVVASAMEQRRLISSLEESESKFKKMFECLPIPYFLYNVKGILLDGNTAAEKAIGYKKSDLVGKSLFDCGLLPREETVKALAAIAKNARGLAAGPLEIRVRKRSGANMLMEVSTIPIRIGKNRIVLGAAIDISARRKMEETIRSSERYFKALTEGSSDIILVIDIEGTVKYVSPSMKKLEAAGQAVLAGKKIHEIGTNKHKDIIAGIFKKIVNDPSYVVQRELEFNGRIYEVMAKNLMNDPAVAGIVVNCRDITERKKVENKLKNVIWQLEHSNEELEQFAYAASHDLKEPLRVVSNYLELLEMRYADKLGGEAREFIYYAVSGTKRMYELIQGMLEYSRIGKKQNEIKLLDLKVVIGEVLQEFGDRALNAVIEVGDLPEVRAIPMEMSLLFRNLIGNAIKFSRKDNKTVIGINAGDTGGEWQICVSDNGIGIEKEYQQKVFGLFERLHTDAEYPGTGLGLTLCKKIVLNLGGKIWIDPGYENGTRICFTLPKNNNTNGGAA